MEDAHLSDGRMSVGRRAKAEEREAEEIWTNDNERFSVRTGISTLMTVTK